MAPMPGGVDRRVGGNRIAPMESRQKVQAAQPAAAGDAEGQELGVAVCSLDHCQHLIQGINDRVMTRRSIRIAISQAEDRV